MNKEQYLNYVMLTQPQQKWSYLLYTYIKENEIKNWKEGFDFIIRWETRNPSDAAITMVSQLSVNPEWAMNVIENDKIGYPCIAAVSMVYGGWAKPEWARKFLEQCGNAPSARISARRMVEYEYASEEWYEKNFSK